MSEKSHKISPSDWLFAARLRYAMAARGLNGNDLEKAAGMAKLVGPDQWQWSGHISRLRNAKRPTPGSTILMKLAGAMGVRMGWLLEGESPVASEGSDPISPPSNADLYDIVQEIAKDGGRPVPPELVSRLAPQVTTARRADQSQPPPASTPVRHRSGIGADIGEAGPRDLTPPTNESKIRPGPANRKNSNDKTVAKESPIAKRRKG